MNLKAMATPSQTVARLRVARWVCHRSRRFGRPRKHSVFCNNLRHILHKLSYKQIIFIHYEDRTQVTLNEGENKQYRKENTKQLPNFCYQTTE